MHQFHEQTVTSWKDFISLTLEYQHGHPRVIGHYFRGQADTSWGLVPSFVRHADVVGITAERAVEIELGAMAEFEKAAALYLLLHLNPPWNDLMGWLTLMQHHGVSTRLLDWTTSPFVAAVASSGIDASKEW